MSDLDKAREWAESLAAGPATDRAQSAAKVIQSLPDVWVDAEKLKAIIADMDHCLKMESTTDFSKGVDNATTSWRDALKALITPKLPTLADMTQEEREACKWMQAKTWYEVGIIVWVDEDAEIAEIITQNNGTLERKFKDVTPLTGEPKLEWPGDAMEEHAPQKLSTQQDYHNAPIGTVVKRSSEGADVFIRTRELIWRNINTGAAITSFKMSGDIREIVTVIEVNK